MSIAQSLLEIVLEESSAHRVRKVNVIKLQVGGLAAVVPDSLSFCFELLSKDTVAAGARLEIETIPIVSRCSLCDIRFEVENHMYLCPECGEPTLELVSGRELTLASIEGETGEGDDTEKSPCGPEHTPCQ